MSVFVCVRRESITHCYIHKGITISSVPVTVRDPSPDRGLAREHAPVPHMPAPTHGTGPGPQSPSLAPASSGLVPLDLSPALLTAPDWANGRDATMCATKRTVGINEPPQGSSFAGSAKEPVSRWSVA